jgi:hypothetical protein
MPRDLFDRAAACAVERIYPKRHATITDHNL